MLHSAFLYHVIANQCARWCGNPFSYCAALQLPHKHLRHIAPDGFAVFQKGKAVLFIQAVLIAGDVDMGMPLPFCNDTGVVDQHLAETMPPVLGENVQESDPREQGIVVYFIPAGHGAESGQCFAIGQKKQPCIRAIGFLKFVLGQQIG